MADEHGLRFEQVALTKENYREVLTPLLTEGGGQGFCVNVSVDTSSRAIMELCRELGAFYIDTVAEPWRASTSTSRRARATAPTTPCGRTILDARAASPGGTTAVSCCGANPGMVSWFVKQALLNIAGDIGLAVTEPTDRAGWAKLMRELGVKGVHIAERDTQRAKNPKPRGVFVNTWSVEGFVSEGNQPAELGWGTHETCDPTMHATRRRARAAPSTCCSPVPTPRALVDADRPGAVRLLVTHNEAVSISDYYTVLEGDRAVYRPTCHYAYHPADDACCPCTRCSARRRSCRPSTTSSTSRDRRRHRRARRAPLRPREERLLVGSQLSIEETRRIAPTRTPPASRLPRPSSPAWSGPRESGSRYRRADEMDFRRCLEVQMPYLGPVVACTPTDPAD